MAKKKQKTNNKKKLSDAENRVLELEEKLNESIDTMDSWQLDVKTHKCINYCTEENMSLQNTSGIFKLEDFYLSL